MNDSIYRISLDIHEHGSQAVLKAKQNDTDRKLYISLREGGAAYIIADDCYAVFKATKPDGSILYNDCTIENNEIVYAFTEKTCVSAGKCRCEIALYGIGDKLITSPTFTLLVDGTIYPDKTVESTNEFSALTAQVSEARSATISAQSAAVTANKVAADLKAAADRGDFDGKDGDKGDKGDKGDPGEQGLKGEKGDKGDKGDPGETVDDSKVGSDPWSSKNTVDKLCPSFTESGSVVTCEPLEGYPLEVITKLPTEIGVSKITLYQSNEDESYEYTVDLGDSYSNGKYNWTTGELDTEDEGLIQLTPKVIIGLPGENTFQSDCGDTIVSGRLDPNQYWSAKLAEQEAIIAGLNKQYELIEDFTLDKDVSQISRTKDLNGVAYNFSAVKIVATFAVAASDSQAVFYVRDKDNSNIFYHTAASGSISKGDTRKSVVTMYNDGGLTNYNALTPTTNKGTTAIACQAIPSSCGREWRNIAAIYITTYNSGSTVPIPAGTRIQIYGIRG